MDKPPVPTLPDYAELQCMSHYSFLHGASPPDQLVARAAQLGYQAIAVADECSLAGVVKAHVAAREWNIHLIIGSQMRVTPEDGTPAFIVLILAMDRDGYGNLSELITAARTRADKGSYLVWPRDIANPNGPLAHLKGLPGCQLILCPKYNAPYEEIERQAEWLVRSAPGRARVALTLHHRAQDDRHRAMVEAIGAEFSLPVVATGDVVMHLRSMKIIQDTMTAIRLNTPVAQCGYQLASNAEAHLRSRLRLGNLYPRDALDETLRVAQRCTFSLDELRYEYPGEIVPEGQTPASYLREQAYIGAHWRYPHAIPDNVQAQLEYELELIGDMQYEPYFLTVFDIVRFARSQKILCQGRGSAANSAVCYCLGITEVDPSRGTLLFERFISRERDEPPDIDVDFEHQRREEVIQYIYRKYGRMRAALTAVVISYRPRSVLRDVGRALGVDLSVVDKVAKASHSWGGRADLQQRLTTCGLDPHSPIAEKWAAIAERLMRFPRHLSQHPGGFVISRGPLSRLVPIENAAMPERTVIQWDKDDIDELGLLKIDVLALGMLSCIARALALISEQCGERFELGDIPHEDAATYQMISQADTVGVFQIESRAQMSMLPRMQPREFYDLVIEVAIIRPGPIQGGMINPYLRRRQGQEAVTYPSPEIEAVLRRTLGVPIFQEQVMSIAMTAAGFTAGEADRLRRAMAAWKRKGGLEQFEDQLMSGMAERGYSIDFATSIVGQIRGFAEYGFPESHAHSFALLAYASSWLKCHHPAEFLAALLNSQPMGFYSRSSLVQDARRHNVEVRPVDVCASGWEASLEPMADGRLAVRLGLNNINGMMREAAWRIEEARAAAPFKNTRDVAMRAQLDAGDMKALASANALVTLTGNRRMAMWDAAASVPERDLMRATTIAEPVLELAPPTEADDIVADYRHIGLTLGRHPLALLRERLNKMRFVPSDILNTFSDGQLARGCGIVTVRQRPETAKGVIFLTLEDECGTINIIVWPTLVEKQRAELMNASLLGVYGIWQSKSGVRNLIAKRLVDCSHLLGQLDTKSRNFH